MARSADARIDGLDERVHSIFSAQKAIWQRNVALFICVLTMADIKLPLCKVGLFFNSRVETHVLAKMKYCKGPPQEGFLHAATHNLSPGSLDNDRKDLLEVPTKNNRKSTKWLVRVPQVSEGAINCLHDMLVLHWSLIPNHQVSLFN